MPWPSSSLYRFARLELDHRQRILRLLGSVGRLRVVSGLTNVHPFVFNHLPTKARAINKLSSRRSTSGKRYDLVHKLFDQCRWYDGIVTTRANIQLADLMVIAVHNGQCYTGPHRESLFDGLAVLRM